MAAAEHKAATRTKTEADALVKVKAANGNDSPGTAHLKTGSLHKPLPLTPLLQHIAGSIPGLSLSRDFASATVTVTAYCNCLHAVPPPPSLPAGNEPRKNKYVSLVAQFGRRIFSQITQHFSSRF